MGKKRSTELTLTLLLIAAQCLEANLKRKIVYVNLKMTFKDARWFCQTNHIDLITLDVVKKGRLSYVLEEKMVFLPVWFGLHRDYEEPSAWKWINLKTGEGVSGYHLTQNPDWANEIEPWQMPPSFPISEDCGSFNGLFQKWTSNVCSEQQTFVCLNDNLVVVKENKTWEDALTHCRNMTAPCNRLFEPCTFDLLSVAYPSDYNYVRDRIYRATTDEVWIGLRFLGGAWWWLNGEELDHNAMLPGCPSQWKHCGAMSKNGSNWLIQDCSERRNFICYEKVEKKHKTK